MNDLISVIVPVYNVASQLERCILSILRQSYPNIGIIAVDDGSTDGSGKLLDALAAAYPNLRVIHQPNGGVTAARLAGIAAAAGDWIGFVDGDDYIEPDMYARLMENAQKHGADISHCGYRMVFDDGRVNWFYNSGRLVVQDRHTGLTDLLEGSLVEPGLCNKLFRRKLFRGLSPDPAIKINEDLLMNYILFSRAENAVFEDFCPYHYIVRSNSASRAPLNEHRIFDPIRVREQILAMDIPGMEDAARRAYLATCINTYNGLMLEKSRKWLKDEAAVRSLLLENRRSFGLLGRKQRLLAELICRVPRIYRYLYRIYATYFLVSRYT